MIRIHSVWIAVFTLHVTAAVIFPQTTKQCSPACHGPTEQEINSFINKLKGPALRPTDPDYPQASTMQNRRVTRHPGLIVYATGVLDVQESVRFAKKHRLLLAVQSTGHSYIGRSTVEGGLLVHLGKMTDIRVNLTSGRCPDGEVTVESGNMWGSVYKEVDKYNKLVVGGSDPSVGMGGYSQGGGHSPYSTSLGLAVDNLLEATLVTADAKIVTVSQEGTTVHEDDGSLTHDSNTDLFWALRGGGGGTWGVVTTFTFRLHAAPSGFVNGYAVYPMFVNSTAPGILAIKAFYKFVETLSPHWGGYLLFNEIPNGPGTFGNVIISLIHYGGLTSAVEAELKCLLASIKVLPVTYGLNNLKTFWDYEQHVPADRGGSRTFVFNSLLRDDTDYDSMIDKLVGHMISPPAGSSVGCTDTILGGAMRNQPQNETSINEKFRTASHSLSCGVAWLDEKYDSASTKAGLGFGEELKQYGGAVYFNEPTEGVSGWKEAFWGDNYDRLVAIKRKWDPEHLFYCEYCVMSDQPRKGYCPFC